MLVVAIIHSSRYHQRGVNFVTRGFVLHVNRNACDFVPAFMYPGEVRQVSLLRASDGGRLRFALQIITKSRGHEMYSGKKRETRQQQHTHPGVRFL